MPAPLAVAAAAAGRAAAGKAAQAAGTRAAQGAASRAGARTASGPKMVESRGSEFFNTERTLEQNLTRRVEEARRRRFGSARNRVNTGNQADESAETEEDMAAQAFEQMAEEEQQAFKQVSQLHQKEGESLSEQDFSQLQTESAKSRPSFPALIFSLALIKDVLDVPLDLTVVAAIFASILSVFCGLALAFWMLGKMSGAWYKRGMIKWFWRRFALVMVIEFIPGLQLIPANVVLVWMAHNRENKAVQLLNNSLEILHGKGFGPRR